MWGEKESTAKNLRWFKNNSILFSLVMRTTYFSYTSSWTLLWNWGSKTLKESSLRSEHHHRILICIDFLNKLLKLQNIYGKMETLVQKLPSHIPHTQFPLLLTSYIVYLSQLVNQYLYIIIYKIQTCFIFLFLFQNINKVQMFLVTRITFVMLESWL